MAALTFLARRTLDGALDLLYPRRCGGCGAYGVGLWCANCDTHTKRFDARDSSSTLHHTGDTATTTVVSAALFDGALREAIHAFKFGGTPHLADTFAKWMCSAWRNAVESATTPDVVVAVPLHRARERERGYNQSEWLARRIAAELQLRYAHHALRRVRATDQQALLSPIQRLANVRDAFSASRQLLHGKRVMIIDDVLTTGATLTECASACMQAGAAGVAALTLARAADSR